jgi:hypothetical protein
MSDGCNEWMDVGNIISYVLHEKSRDEVERDARAPRQALSRRGHLKTEFNILLGEHTGENITSLVIILTAFSITPFQNETKKLIGSIILNRQISLTSCFI